MNQDIPTKIISKLETLADLLESKTVEIQDIIKEKCSMQLPPRNELVVKAADSLIAAITRLKESCQTKN